MSLESSNFILSSARNQWLEMLWLIIFAVFFCVVLTAKFTNQLDNQISFLPRKPIPLIIAMLVGCLAGGWYGFENSVNTINTISCEEGKGIVQLSYPYKIVNLDVAATTTRPALVSYRGGQSWRLRFYAEGKRYDTVQLGVVEMRDVRNFTKKCGVKESAPANV